MTVDPTVCVVISHKFYNKTKPLFENAFCKANQIKQQNVTFTHRREHNTVKQQIASDIIKFTMQINKNIFPNMNFQCKKLKRDFRVKLKGHF